jgi:hypothetical protein
MAASNPMPHVPAPVVWTDEVASSFLRDKIPMTKGNEAAIAKPIRPQGIDAR